MADNISADTRTQYWQEQIDAWQASGQSQLAFCRTNELNYPRFGYWLRKFRNRGAEPGLKNRRAFIPVVGASAGEGLSVHLPNGIELRGVNEQNVRVVEQLLARL